MDLIDRADVLETFAELYDVFEDNKEIHKELHKVYDKLRTLPAVQPEPLSDAYTKAVWTWLLDYQIKAAKLKGRYTPYEVLSWVANDWRKEHEGSD